MGGSHRLSIIALIAVMGLAIPGAVSPYALNLVSDAAAKATIAAAFIALFGVVLSSVFSGISAYYKDRGDGMQKKFQLVFPMIRDYYNPWIQGSKYLSDFLKLVEQADVVSIEQTRRALYYLAFFYSSRLRLSLEAGGRPILADTQDEENVMDAYREIENSLQWAGTETRTKTAQLQDLFLNKEKELGRHYLSNKFISDASNPDNKVLYEDSILFQKWLSNQQKEGLSKVVKNLETFRAAFLKGIDKLNSSWKF